MLAEWGARDNRKGESRSALSIDGRQVAQFVDRKDSAQATIEGVDWELSKPAKGDLSGSSAAGARLVAAPVSERKGKPGDLGRAKRTEVTLTDASGKETSVVLENCGKQDYVFETGQGVKLGQYSGGNSGVRQLVVEVEPGQEDALTVEQLALVAWLARVQLESRLLSSTWMWTVLLIVLIPIMILAFLIQ